MSQPYEIHIKPNRSWIRFNVKEIIEYKDLLYLLVRRDFVSRFKQTILGPAWFVIQPLFMTVIFTVIFGKIASIPTDGLPQMLFYQCGLLIWNYFNTTFTSNAGIFTANAAIYSKVYYPRIINPLANCVSGLFGLAIQFITFIGFFVYFKFFTLSGETFSMGINALLFIPLVVQVLLLALGMGLWMSVLTAKYRDLAHLQGLITQALMYSSIIYPLSSVPERFQWVTYLNPISPCVEACRILLLGKGTLTSPQMLTSLSWTVVILITGMLLFQKTERTVVDTV